MGSEAGQRKTPTYIFIVTPSLEGWPTKAKEAPSPHEVRLASLDTNPVFQCLGVEVPPCELGVSCVMLKNSQ